jgi:hypothetical protein
MCVCMCVSCLYIYNVCMMDMYNKYICMCVCMYVCMYNVRGGVCEPEKIEKNLKHSMCTYICIYKKI